MQRLAARLQKDYACSPEDFALLAVLVGNDFLPPLPGLLVRDDGLDTLFEARARTLREARATGIVALSDATQTTGGRPDVFLMTQLMENLATTEDERMRQTEQRHKNLISRYSRQKESLTLLEDLPLMDPFPDVVLAGRPGWRPRYHREVLHLHAAADVRKLCVAYVEGWIWSYRYTHQRLLSAGWYYPYAGAPTAMDVHNYMLGAHDAMQAIEKDVAEKYATLAPESTAIQLLMVMPPQSKALVPKDVQCIMTDVQRGCVHWYPETFQFDRYLRVKTWECHARLPDIDIEKLRRAVAVVTSS